MNRQPVKDTDTYWVKILVIVFQVLFEVNFIDKSWKSDIEYIIAFKFN